MHQHLPKHIDHENEGFRLRDLEKLIIQTNLDLDKIDELRRHEFKNYEMQKELERRLKLEVTTLFIFSKNKI